MSGFYEAREGLSDKRGRGLRSRRAHVADLADRSGGFTPLERRLGVWTAIAPGPMSARIGTWTGSELVTWAVSGGGRYDPLANTWAPLSPGGPAGEPLLIFARPGLVLIFTDVEVAVYDLIADTWTPLAYPSPAPDFADENVPAGADLGSDLFIFNGRSARFGPL